MQQRETEETDLGAGELDTLAAAAAAGDREAFRRIVLALQTDVRVFIAWRLGSREDVEDVLQDTFLTAYRRLPTYRGGGVLRAWLRAIARNHVYEALRERRRLQRHRRDALDALVDEAAEAANDACDREDELVRLRGCMDALSARARRLVELRYLRQMPLAEVAQHARQPKARLSVQLHRIRQALLECLRGAGVGA